MRYATRLRVHLADSRRRGLPWEQAWRKALRELVPETDFPLCRNEPDCKRNGHACREIRGWFRDAYMDIGPTRLAGVSALAENDRWTDAPEYHAPERTSRRCGWGGSGGCDKPGEPWLCPEHAAVIDAIPVRCGSHLCKRNAEPGSTYCAKHAHKAEANQRGADALHERRAA